MRTLRSLGLAAYQGNSPPPTNQDIKIEEVEIDSKIPTKYYIVQSFPIFPQDFSNKGYKIYFDDGKWNVVLWPSKTSNYKDEVRYLSSAVDRMMDSIEVTEMDEEHPEKTKLQMLTQKADLLGIALDELNRQITRENHERGELMARIVKMFLGVIDDIPGIYNEILLAQQKESEKTINELREQNHALQLQEQDTSEELRSQKILLEMQNQWHTDLEAQIDEWKDSLSKFNERLASELKKQKDEYEDKLSDLQVQLSSIAAERDGYKSQIDWEQKSIQDKEVEVLKMRKELANTKALLEEREQTLYTARAHFERQFTFMREQMGQMAKTGNTTITLENMNNITQMLPPRHGEQLPFLSLEEVNKRIYDIYLSKIRHDAAYVNGSPPPLYKFVVKYHIALMFGYKPAISAVWQFMDTCDRYKHESANVGMFMKQVEEESWQLKVLQFICMLVKKEPVCEIGLPRLTIVKCISIASRILPDTELPNLQRLLEKKVINPKRGMTVELDIFMQILLDFLLDVNQTSRQRIMFQFRELLSCDGSVEFTQFGDFISRFAPDFSAQRVGDLFLDAMQASLPSLSVTESAFQLLVDRGLFEEFKPILSDDLDIANAEEIAAFVNLRWKTDIAEHVNSALVQLKSEKMAECQTLFSELGQINEHMKMTVTTNDAGTGVSLLHKAALLLVRLKFLNIARKDGGDMQKEIRKLIDLVWN